MSAEYALAGFVLIHELIGLPNRFHQRRDAEYTADADGELDIRTIVNHGAADGVLNIAQLQKESLLLNPGEDDEEFVAAIANQHVGAADAGENCAGDLL